MTPEQMEKYSSAITLSDMEVFVFPELIYPHPCFLGFLFRITRNTFMTIVLDSIYFTSTWKIRQV